MMTSIPDRGGKIPAHTTLGRHIEIDPKDIDDEDIRRVLREIGAEDSLDAIHGMDAHELAPPPPPVAAPPPKTNPTQGITIALIISFVFSLSGHLVGYLARDPVYGKLINGGLIALFLMSLMWDMPRPKILSRWACFIGLVVSALIFALVLVRMRGGALPW